LELANALKFNCSIKSLTLSSNKFRRDGILPLATTLRENAAITELNLQRNDLGPDGIKHIGKSTL
jgi:hypothetical protein